jgi:transposase
MTQHSSRKFTSEQRRELQELLKTTPKSKVYRRARMLLYLDEGLPADQIQTHTGYAERAQFFWLRRYREEGSEGLDDRPRSGRPRKKEDGAVSRVFPLGVWARITLEQMWRHHPKASVRTRAQIILLRNKGYAVPRIADIVGLQPRTVGHVIATYRRDKLAGLYRKTGSGRLSKLGRTQWEQFKRWVVHGPKALGYRFVKWTTRSLRWYLYKHFNVMFCREWIRYKLHQFVEYSWTRGKKVYAYAKDATWKAKRQAFCQQVLKLLHRAQKGEIILLFEDEAIRTLGGLVGYSWSPVGTTQEVPTLGKRGRVVVFGAADPISGRTHRRTEKTINQYSTLRFLKQLVRYYREHQPDKELVIVFDKHSGHTAYIIAEYLVEQEHFSVLTTPPKSPDLNPSEHLWDWLDEQMIKNAFFEHTKNLKKAVSHFFSYIAGRKEGVISWMGDLQTLYSAEVGI